MSKFLSMFFILNTINIVREKKSEKKMKKEKPGIYCKFFMFT